MNVAHLSVRYIREGVLGQVIKPPRWRWGDCVRIEGLAKV